MSQARDLPRLLSEWATGADFRAQLVDADGARTFFHPAHDGAELPAGATAGVLLSVTLRFLDRDIEFHVHARVVERSATGLRLAFLPEERDRQELVLASAEGESVPYIRRKAVRTPCDLAVQVTPEGASPINARLTTISERGAHVELDHLAPGQRLELNIAFARQRVRVGGRVTAAVAGPQRGAGIEFLFVSSKQRDAVAAAVGEFRAALPRG